MSIERYHWRHFFGGVTLVLLLLQLLSGLFLIWFYKPHLKEAYASVQYLYKHFPAGAWLRDVHRWVAFFSFVALIVHMTRSLLRKEFLNYKRRTVWLTGFLCLIPLIGFLATGFILPWEWKGYWFMEMVPNYFGAAPYVGTWMKESLIAAFTLNRAFVVHILVLPVITLVLIDIHALSRVRKRRGGIPRYLIRHGLLTLPFFIIVTVLAIYIPMPTQDPEVIPMPLEGAFIPTAEWFVLIALVPFMYFEDFWALFLGLYLPLMAFVLVSTLPYYFRRRRRNDKVSPDTGRLPSERKIGFLGMDLRVGASRKAVGVLTVVLTVSSLLGPLYAATYRSPALGCSSCHNRSMGGRMGVPPDAFKDRDIVPLLDDNEWMVKHWFYPQVTW